MSDQHSTVTIHPRHVDGHITDGRVTVATGAVGPQLRVEPATVAATQSHDRAASLCLEGDDIEIIVELTAGNVETLAAALANAGAAAEAGAEGEGT